MRFHQQDLLLLKECLEIPDEVSITQRRYRVPGMTALCVMLKRLAYPNRLSDMESFFGMSSAALSSIAQHMVNHIVERKGNLLSSLDSHAWLNGERLAHYAQAVARKGAPLHNCWGFIDGTARHICRPSMNQEQYYSGHKRHDAGIFRETEFIEQLRRLCENTANRYVLYGDAAYPISEFLLKPYPQTTADVDAMNFNRSMSAVRQAVEWGFGKVVREWAFVDFHKNLKIMKQDVPNIYKVACLPEVSDEQVLSWSRVKGAQSCQGETRSEHSVVLGGPSLSGLVLSATKEATLGMKTSGSGRATGDAAGVDWAKLGFGTGGATGADWAKLGPGTGGAAGVEAADLARALLIGERLTVILRGGTRGLH
ncbi:hypothetical protein GE061_001270 [Apolygus lucorum]|uniref:DDE Tnp4 domain-containing protein n=1 Tax=Apolygus lucorum TaxID=248454 RepID=A0A8S9Y8B6_APOLU|nr:hypothetical protein GE061_001270 [Apolygus lucorum]